MKGTFFFLLKVVFFTLLYIVLAKAGLLLALDGGFASPVWLGSGTALLILLFNGIKFWPAVTLGTFFVNFISGGTLEFAAIISIGNTLEAIVAYKIVGRNGTQSCHFNNFENLLLFLIAAAIGSFVSASFGGLAYVLTETVLLNLNEIVGTWWLGDFTSFLIIIPLFSIVKTKHLKHLNSFIFYVSFPVLIFSCYVAFFLDHNSKVLSNILLYSLFIFPAFLCLTKIRFFAFVNVLIILGFAIAATYFGKGPFALSSLNDSLIILQSYMSILIIVTLMIFVGISEREMVKSDLKELVFEKETLLSEIHHRVKNNLAIVSGLLYLQGETIEDEIVKSKLNQMDLRIKTIALVHEKLYKQSTEFTVDVSDYLDNLAKLIFRINDSKTKLILDVESVYLPIEKAQPLGLIVNELITNSFKHAFKNQEESEIEINFKNIDNQYYLLVRDNGTGLMDDRDDSLGLTLISVLADQIDAIYKVNTDSGTRYEFYFT